jgi:nuclear pore complex protein Nup98-Nup96
VSGNSSLFGNSQQQQNPLQQQHPGSLHADLLGSNVYGSASIFSGLPQPSSIPSGPVATPLKTPTQVKKQTPLSFYKTNPNSANRLLSPTKKGYGFSYSTYGSPATPGSSPNTSLFGGSLLGGSFGRSLGRTTSLTNLRRSYDSDQPSVIAPGAFSLNSGRGFSNPKRLQIDRNVRIENLFSPKSSSTLSPSPGETPSQPNKLKKRVSFDAGALGKDSSPEMNGALVLTETNGLEPTAEELGFLRSRRGNDGNGVSNGVGNGISNGFQRQPEMEQVRGNELAIVPEDDSVSTTTSSHRKKPGDPEPGDYWCKPPLAELKKMSQSELKQVRDFEAGRYGCGFIHFDEPVDLTTVKLDELLGGVIQIDVRSMTVYLQNSNTPPVGTGLNVPSTITMENSWARSKNLSMIYDQSGPKIDRHIERLKKTKDTTFVSFHNQTGVWVFRVEHFTTYEMYDDDDTEMESFNQSTLSAPPDTPTPKPRTPLAQRHEDVTEELSSEESDLEDTYDFKRKSFPGAFNPEATFDDDNEAEQERSGDEHFLGDGSVGSASIDEPEADRSEEELESDQEMEMAGAFPTSIPSAEQENTGPLNSILKGSQLWTPGKVQINFDSSWAEQLQRTVSPKKQDREALREIQKNALIDIDIESTTGPASKEIKDKGFRNTIDLMSSLFGKHEEQRLGRKLSGSSKSLEV